MRLLGIDYGTKRVGIAVSDVSGKMAFPHSVLKNDASLLEEIGHIVDEYEVQKIVIGHSLNKDMSPNNVQSDIETLVTDITLEWGLPVHLQSELFSTQAALRIQGRNAATDASAAALILDAFIQSNN